MQNIPKYESESVNEGGADSSSSASTADIRSSEN